MGASGLRERPRSQTRAGWVTSQRPKQKGRARPHTGLSSPLASIQFKRLKGFKTEEKGQDKTSFLFSNDLPEGRGTEHSFGCRPQPLAGDPEQLAP